MDAKDLRIQPVQSDHTHSHDGNINYASSSSSTHYDKNKSYHGIGTDSLSKVDVQTSRPCAVIGPDRIVPAPLAPDPSIKRAHVVPWSFTRPSEHPHITDYQQQLTRNISPRQTYQENMTRHVLPPGYTAKLNEDMNVIEKNALASKIPKSNLPHEVKYTEVPYNVSPLNSDPKSSRNSELSVNDQNPNLMQTHTAWPPGSNVCLTRPYAASELYQYPEYANYNAPRVLPVMRPHRTAAEESLHVYPDPYHRGANIRYEPYPPAKDRYQQTRYDYIPTYSNPYAAPHFMQKLPPNIPPHPYSGYPQTKYLDKVRETHRDAYQRIPNPQGGYNVPYPNQGIHTNHGSVPGNCVQNKIYAYPSDVNAHPAVTSKTPYIHNKSYTPHQNFYPSEVPRSQQMKPQMMMPGYLPIHMQPMPSYPYYRKDTSVLPVKNYDYSQIKNIDPYTNQMSRMAPQFSPNIISPVRSTTSNDVNAIAISPEDFGYVSQSSTASVRSSDSAMNYYRALEHRYGHMQRPSHVSRSEDARNEIIKDSTGLDIRQFLQKWSDGDDEYSTGGNGSREIVQAISIEPKNNNQPKSDQDQLVVLDLVNVSNEDLGKYEHIEKVSKLPDNIKGYTSIDLLNQFEEVTRPRQPEKKEMQAKTAAFVHNMSTSLPSRPLSPLDVEAKISQSIIHKDVGCNFEIKPCSPKIMNVELAAPARTLIEERIIEKVTNPVNDNTPNVPPTNDDQTNNYNVTRTKNQRKSVTRRQDNTANIPSCKMFQTPYSSISVDNEKSSYSLQDLESNSGVCFASLPRLDNDIELSFPEVNQQFINDNKVEPSTPNKDYKNLLTSNICSSENSSNDDTGKKILSNYPVSPTEKNVPRLSKYRKSKTSSEYMDTISQANAQLTRKDSVIIKNPENQHISDEKTMSIMTNVAEKTKHISFSKEYLPMNLAISNTTDFNVSTVATQEETCPFNSEFVENMAINLSQHIKSSESTEGLCSSMNKKTLRDKPPLTITNDVTRVLLEELESSNVIDRYQCEIRPQTSTSLLNSDQKVINAKTYQLPEGDGQPKCSSVNKTDSEKTEVQSRNKTQIDRIVPNTKTCPKEFASSKGKKEYKNKISHDVSTKCCNSSLAKPFEVTVPLESSRSPSYLTSKVSNDSDFHLNDTDVNATDDITSHPHLKNISGDKMLVPSPTSTDSVPNKDHQNIEERKCNAQQSNCTSIESTQYDIVKNTAILRTNESACVSTEKYHNTNESICGDHAESITSQLEPIDTERIIINKSCILGEKNLSSVQSTNTMDFETIVNELDNHSNIVKSDDSSYVLNDRIQDESENYLRESETVIAHVKTNKLNSDIKVVGLDNTNCVQNKAEDHLDMKTKYYFDQAAEYMAEGATPNKLVHDREIRPEDSRYVISDVHQKEKNIVLCDHPESISTPAQTTIIELCKETEIVKSNETAKPSENELDNNTGCVRLDGSICASNKVDDDLDVKKNDDSDIATESMNAGAAANELENDSGIITSDSSISVPGEDHDFVQNTLLPTKQSSEISTYEPSINDLDNDIRSYDFSVLNEIHDDSKENICSEQSPKSSAVNPSVTELVNDKVNSKPNCILNKNQQNSSDNVCNKTDIVETTIDCLPNNIGNNTNLVGSDDSEKYFDEQGTKSIITEPPASELKMATTIDESDNCLNNDLGSVQDSNPMACNSTVTAQLDESHRVQQENQQDADAKPCSNKNTNNLKNETDVIESNCLVSNLKDQQETKKHESLPTVNRIGHGIRNNHGSIFDENICGELFPKAMDIGRPQREVIIGLEDSNKNTAVNSAFKEHTKNIQVEQEATTGIRKKHEVTKVIQTSMVSIDKNSNNESIDVTNEPSHMSYGRVTFPTSKLLTQHKQSRESNTEMKEFPNTTTIVSNCIENKNDTTGEPFKFLDRRSKSPTLSDNDESPFHSKPDSKPFGSSSHEQMNLKFNEALVTHSLFSQSDDLVAESHDNTIIGIKREAFGGERTDDLNNSFYKRRKIDNNCGKHKRSPCFNKRMYSPIFRKLYNYQEGSCCRTLESISKISKLANYIEDIAIGVIDDISSDEVNDIEMIPIGIPHEEVYQNIKNMQRHFALIDKTNEDSLENYKTMEFMQKHTVRESGIKRETTLTNEESTDEKNISEIISSCCYSESDRDHNTGHIEMIHLREISEPTPVTKEESSSIDLSINNVSETRETVDNTNSYLDISKNKEIEGGSLKQKLTDIDSFSRRSRHTLKRSLSESSLCTYRNNTKDRFNESCNKMETLHGSNKRKKLEQPVDEENSISNIDVESDNYCSFLQNRRNSISTIYHDDVSFCIFINDDCIITQEEYDNETNSLEDIKEVNLQNIESSIEEDIEEVEAVNVPYQATEALLPDPFPVECIEERDVENWVEVACVETVVSDDIVEDDGDLSVDKSYSPNYGDTVQSEISEFDVYSDHTDKLKNIYGVGLCSNNFDLIKTLYTTPQMDVNKTLHYKESLLECDNRYECSDIDDTTNTISNCIENEMLCLHESREDFILDTEECGQDDFKVLGLSLSSTITKAKDDIHSNTNCVNDQLCDVPRTAYQPYKRTSSSPEVSSTTTEEKKSSILLKITNHNGSRTSHINNNNNNIAEDSKKIRCKFTENTDYSSCKSSSTSRPLITKGAQKYIPPSIKDTIHDLKVKLFLPQHKLKNLKYLKMSKDGTKINHLTSRNLNNINNLKPALVKKKAKPNFEDVLKSIDEIHIKKHKDKSKGVPKVIIKKSDSGSHYTSNPETETFNPDMTGRKWQPWVFLEKNKFIDKMASRGKKNAVFCHRKNCYVLTENFKKYKSSSTKFIISQPSSKDMSTAPLRYTIKLKQSY